MVVGRDPDTDLAVIRLTEKPAGPLTVIPMGDSDKLVGQKVLAIGNPFGLDRTLTTGVISGLQRPIRARNNRLIEGAIQTDASINPGNSGGPLLDSRAHDRDQLADPFAVRKFRRCWFCGAGRHCETRRAAALQNGQVRRPKLGISTRDVDSIRNQVDLPVSDGVLIIQVARGSGAAAGLRGMQQTEMGDFELGDIIVGINNDKVTNSDDLFRVLDKYQIGDTVQVQIWRDGRRCPCRCA